MTFIYTLKIGGNEITDSKIINMVLTREVNKASRIDLRALNSIVSDYSIIQGNAVTLQYGATGTEYYAFRGTVESINQVGGEVVINCYDKLFQLTKRLANTTYDKNDADAGVISDIIIDLITTFGGLNANTDSIEATGSTTIQTKLFCFDSVVMDKVVELANIFGYVVYYDSNENKVFAHEKGYYVNDDSFSTNTNIISPPAWVDDTTNVFNYLRLYGSSKTVTKVELFNGDGSETTFALSYVPDTTKAAIKVEENVAGTWTERTFGREGTTLTYDYMLDDDPAVKSVIFSNNIPAAGADNVRITYSYVDVLFTEIWDSESASSYPAADGGYRYAVFNNIDIQAINDLENTANAMISTFNNPDTSVSLTVVGLTDLPQVGYSATIIDGLTGRTESLYISKVRMTYPHGQVINVELSEMTGSVQQVLKSPMQRLRALEEASRGNLTFVRVSAMNNPMLELPLIQVVSTFKKNEAKWDITNDWDSSAYWSEYESRDDFSYDTIGDGLWTVY